MRARSGQHVLKVYVRSQAGHMRATGQPFAGALQTGSQPPLSGLPHLVGQGARNLAT